MKDVEHICFYCGSSRVTKDAELFCVLKQQIVEEEETCEQYG